MRDDFAVEVGKERADAARAIGADVRGESAAEGIGKPADEWDVAEYISAAEIRAVRLEWIETVWRKDDHAAAGFYDAVRFANRLRIVGDVLDDFMEKDRVESVVGKGERFRD